MNTKAKRKSVEWKIEKELKVLKGDIEILEALAKGKFKDYDGKAVNGWLEKRMKSATDDVYLKQDEYFKGNQYTVVSNKWYQFDTAHGYENEASYINIMIECTEDNNFIYNEFEKQIQNSITRKKERIAKLENLDLDKIFERYNELYNELLEFKEQVRGIDGFGGITNFY